MLVSGDARIRQQIRAINEFAGERPPVIRLIALYS
jgi:hypothetical protein